MRVYIECPVCLEGFVEPTSELASKGEVSLAVVVVTKCRHLGHLACMKKWVDYAKKCPECSRELLVYEYSIVRQDRVVYSAPGFGASFRVAALCGLGSRLSGLVGRGADEVWSDELVGYVLAVVSGILQRPLPSQVEVSDGRVRRLTADGWVLESGRTLRDGMLSERWVVTRGRGPRVAPPDVVVEMWW